MLTLRYKELYLDFDSDYQFPIEDFSKSIPKLIGNSRDAINLDFTGIDELTDEVFYVLQEELKTTQKQNVEIIDLTGCLYITDRGIAILAQSFRNLRKLTLTGCTKLTQLSLLHLIEYCTKLEDLEARFTAISYLSNQLNNKWNKNGNKIIVNPLLHENNQETLLPLNLVILSMESDFKYDIAHFLINKELRLRQTTDPIVFTPYAWKLGDTDINIVELYCPICFMAPFIQERSVFILAMDATTNYFNAFNAIRCIDFIRGVTYCCPIEILAITDSSDNKPLEEISGVLTSIFTDQSENMTEHLNQENYSKSTDKDFIDQMRFIQSLASIDPEHISLYLTGVNSSQKTCSMCYNSTICEPSTNGRKELISRTFLAEFRTVRDSMERINKADISEIRSFSVMPENLIKIMYSALKILNLINDDENPLDKTEKVKQIHNFLHGSSSPLVPFLNIDTLMEDTQPERSIKILVDTFGSKEELEKNVESSIKASMIQKYIRAVGLWLLAKWEFCLKIEPLMKKARFFAVKTMLRSKAESSYEIIKLNLEQDFHQIKNYMYTHLPDRYTDGMRVVMNSLEKISRPFIWIKPDLIDEIEIPLTNNELLSILGHLQISGRICLLDSGAQGKGLVPMTLDRQVRTDQIVVINDIQMLVKLFNKIIKESVKFSINDTRVWGLPGDVPVATYEEIKALFSDLVQEEEMCRSLLTALISYGIMVSLGLSWQEETQHFVPQTSDSHSRLYQCLYVCWNNLPIKPRINTRALLNPDIPAERETNILKQVFPDNRSDNFSKDDLSFKFSFKFRTGIPCNLFNQIVSFLIKNYRIHLLWSNGLLLREGAMDILILHNIHASRGSSSFELESRIKNSIDGRRPVAVREHMWSVLSDVMTIIEGAILDYPYLHHKLRHYCRGQCFLELGQESTFSPTEVGRNLNCTYFCYKCREYQMSQSEWLYIISRQLILPNHEIDIFNKTSCNSCWKREYMIKYVWNHQLKIYPVFAELVFASSAANLIDGIQGNVIKGIRATSENDQACVVWSDTKCSSNQMCDLTFHVLDKTNVKIRLVAQQTNGVEQDVFVWNLDTGLVEKCSLLQKMLEKTTELIWERKENKVIDVENGNNLRFIFSDDMTEVLPILIVKVNDVTKAIYATNSYLPEVPYSLYLRINIQPTMEDNENNNKLIISSIDAARVTANHFRPGMIVLMKGKTRWEPAVISTIIKGKLHCIPLQYITPDSDEQIDITHRTHQISLDTDTVLPPAIYPSEINCTLDSKNPKALTDHWLKILGQYSKFVPAPYGLFPRLIGKSGYEPLPLLIGSICGGFDPGRLQTCTSSLFTPSRLLRVLFRERSVTSRLNTSYLPLPHPMTPEQLLVPHRSVINQFQDQSLHRLCPGISWRNYLNDHHPMNEEPRILTEEEAAYTFQGPIFSDIFILMKNFSTNFLASYQYIDKCFPLINPDINKSLLRDAILAINKTYRDIYLFDIVSKIKNYSRQFLLISQVKLKNSKAFDTKKKNKKFLLERHETKTNIFSQTKKWSSQDEENVLHLLMAQASQCESHKMAKDVLRKSDLGPYCQCIVNMILNKVNIENVASCALPSCIRLARLELSNSTVPDTNWLKLLPPLKSLTLKDCNLKEIGEEIFELRHTLKQLSMDSNPIEKLPDFFCQLTLVNNLSLNDTLISELPDNFGDLKELRYLSLDRTRLTKLPQSFSNLKFLITLKISGVTIVDLFTKRAQKAYSVQQWQAYCKKEKSRGTWLYDDSKALDLLSNFLGENDMYLSYSEYTKFQRCHFDFFPRFQEFPVQIFGCESLQVIVLPNQAFKQVPDDIQKLTNLKKVIIEHNLNLETLSGHLGTCPLEILSCQGCVSLKTPPPEVINRGMRNTIAYLLRLVSGSEAFYRTKLMLVGLGGAGKTSLMRALMSKDYKAPQLTEESITDGIDIAVWSAKSLPTEEEIKNNSREPCPIIQFSVWDFAGQTLYYNTHQFFLTDRAVYLLMWNVRQGFEHAGLDFWLNSITCHAPKCPIFIVGTHADKVGKSEIPTETFLQRYPSIVGFHFVSSLTGSGIKELHDQILRVTRKQPYMGEIVPNVWLRFEKSLIRQRSTSDYLTWSNVKSIAISNAIYDGEINRAIRFLHDLGSIQYFEMPLLKDYVIINSQWLVDVMACVVSVKNSLIKDGRLEHANIKEIWRKYPSDLHEWLLRLTEIFDLTFSVPGQTFNYVPCLLPNQPPSDFHWADYVETSNQVRESNMVYVFEYLPPGLFNRAQVRLSYYSDAFVIWQDGSLLQKNEDQALMYKLNDKSVRICARGYWPDNIVFIIHEVFETLISEAFSGVNYEYQITCKKCVAEKEAEPHYFSKFILQRATKSKTAFIQCHKNFHIIPMQDIQESMPPDSLEDYDLQFKRSVQFIQNTQDQLHDTVMVIVDQADYMEVLQDVLFNTPRRIVKDLQRYYTVNCEPVIETAPQDTYINNISISQVIIVIVSKRFIANKLCSSLLKIAKSTLRKNMCFIILDKEYKSHTMGMEMVEEVYFNFQRSEVYDLKLEQLRKRINQYLGEEDDVQTGIEIKPRVFLSYCWDNSHRAFLVGNSKFLKEDAIGWGDPRDIKDFLEQNGIPCWLDIEQAHSSLYSDITEGLKNCEILLACMSSEYIQSDICRKEFMFAKNHLQMPILIAEVGQGDDWMNSEIGLLTMEYEKIKFQTKSNESYDKLLKCTKEMLESVSPQNGSGQDQSSKSQITKKKLASQEDFELIQRKMYRLLMSGFGSEDSRIYPCLFIVDVIPSSNDNDDDDEDNDEQGDNDSNDGLVGEDVLTGSDKNGSSFSLCIRVVCENESGWHTSGDVIPLNLTQSETFRFLELAAPYFHRIVQLLRLSAETYNLKMEDNQNKDECDAIGSWKMSLFDPSVDQGIRDMVFNSFKQNARSWNFVKPIHKVIRNYIIDKDVDRNCGDLKNCCLNSGKLIWLCEQHRQYPHISVLDNSETDSLLTSLSSARETNKSERAASAVSRKTNDQDDNEDDRDEEERIVGDDDNDEGGIDDEDQRRKEKLMMNRLEAIHLEIGSETDSMFSSNYGALNETNKLVLDQSINVSPKLTSQQSKQEPIKNPKINPYNQTKEQKIKTIQPNSEKVPATNFMKDFKRNESEVCILQ